MPGGSEPLLPLQWQTVPGDREAQIYPLIRKVDTVSSNTFIVKTPDAVILIDPGGLFGQAAQIASIVQEVRSKEARPLVVILTHTHVDHYLAAVSVPALTDPEIAIIAVQENGAEALESADCSLTLADLLGREIAPLRADLRLFAAADGAPVTRTYPNGAVLTVMREEPETGLLQERIVFAGGSSLEVYHTPGHSPDSCCIRIGGLLFTGDPLFAANPGMVGIPGWNREALIRSISGIQALLSRGGISAVCPGHGWALTAGDAARMLAAVASDAQHLTGLAEMNPDRARAIAAFAEDCMEQVNELFTVMAGRLYYVSHVMEELGESDTAAGLHALIRSEAIDELLDAFAAFNAEHRAGGHVPINLALKAGQVIARLQRSFDQDRLAEIIDPTLVQRAERLLCDYMTMLRGFCPSRECMVQDLRPLLEACIMGHTVWSCSDDDVLASADDDAAFGRLLLARIGMCPLLADIGVTLETGAETVAVPVDRERFLDLMTYLLEDLVGTGAGGITIRIKRDGEAAVVALSGAYESESLAGGGEPRTFLYRLCEWAGGTLDYEGAAGLRRFTIRFAPAA